MSQCRPVARFSIVGRIGVLAVLLLISVPESGSQSLAETPAPAAETPEAQSIEIPSPEADRDLLRQTMVDARIATDRSRPGITLWARDTGIAFSQWIAGWMERVLPRFARGLAPFFEPVLMVLLALLAAVLLGFLARYALERWRRREGVAIPGSVQRLGAADEDTAARDWEGELRRYLAKGDVAASIEALWWWLASRLVADRAGASWTSRELVNKAGRRDLLTVVRRLDRMMYGAVRPSTDEVSRLWGDLREVVG